METGYFPTHLKIARLIPTYKSGEASDPTNYRPIASLPFLSKIVERVIAIRLNYFLEKNSIISNCQFGFQKSKSTFNALHQLTEKIYSSLNDKQYLTSIFIDLKKAFDSVNHKVLLEKMELAGIRGMALEWFRSYLSDREYFVRIGSSSSNSIKTNIGLPQGSILGPICFLLYIKDFPNISNNLHVTLCADDTTVSIADENSFNLSHIINNELLKISNWTKSNRLTINTNKTEALIFTTRKISEAPQVKLNNEKIIFGDCTKFLGVLIDKNLRFDKHVSHILSKVSKNAGILYRIRDSLSMQARLNFYYGFIYPYLTYNVAIWGSASQTTINPLIIQQKRIIRTICNANKYDHTSPLFYRLKILKLSDIVKYELSLCNVYVWQLEEGPL